MEIRQKNKGLTQNLKRDKNIKQASGYATVLKNINRI